MSALLDTGFLLAAIIENDDLHDLCAETLEAETAPLLPDLVLPELAYLILRDGDYEILTDLLDAIVAGELKLVDTLSIDLARASELLKTYKDTQIDFVDCVIVAMAERLNITRILTIDRRHFTIVRPKDCAYFKVLP